VAFLVGRREESARPRFKWTYTYSVQPHPQDPEPTQVWHDTNDGSLYTGYGKAGKYVGVAPESFQLNLHRSNEMRVQ